MNKKVLFITIGNINSASSRVYVYQYLPYLKMDDIEFDVLNFGPHFRNIFKKGLLRYVIAAWSYLSLIGKILKLNFIVCTGYKQYQVFFFQKVLLLPIATKWLKYNKCKIIYCIDDAVYLKENILSLGIYRRKHFDLFLDKCDKIVIGTSFYRDKFEMFKNKMALIPNAVKVPEEIKNKNNRSVSIGWIGSANTTKYLNIIERVFRKLHEEFGEEFQLILIGAGKTTLREQSWCKVYDWSLEEEENLLSKIDIGIMPLNDTEWEKGKCGYKIIQYFAASIPAVVSPVGINSELIEKSGAGFLCDNYEAWLEKVKLLILDGNLRKEMGAKGFEFAKNNHAVEVIYNQLYKKVLLED